MASTVTTPSPFCHSSPTKNKASASNPRICFLVNAPNKVPVRLTSDRAVSPLSALAHHKRRTRHYTPKSGSSFLAISSEYKEELETKVKFPTTLSLPGCSSSLSLLGTGYREKVFAIIGVQVYAAGLYANQSVLSKLDPWKGRSATELQQDSSLFDAIYSAPLEKSLHIVLVRDIDGKTFWDALDEAISPRIKSQTPVDETALSTFRGIFQGRPLKKGTSIFLTWLDTAKMLVCVSTEGKPSSVDATIESSNVTSALFDVFLGASPVSPTLKASVSDGFALALK